MVTKMANTYTTVINQLFTITTPAGFVVDVSFTVSGTDGKNIASIGGSCEYTFQEGQLVIPYDQLTEAVIMGWVNESTGNQVDYYANIDGQIETIINPPVLPQDTPLPW
jgi:hypothetical protein